MHVYELEQGSTSLDGLHRRERPDPEPGHGQVLVRMRAASLNYRDLMIASGQYGGSVERDTIPLSDGAGEVEAVGEGVSRFAPGDRVVGLFSQTPPDGPRAADPAALGAPPMDGTLAQKRVSYEDDLLPIPSPLDFEEAATLPCAAVTAWHALMGVGAPLRAGQTVLCLGTGGVSIFALQFAKAAGARVVLTSSSDEKLERGRALGADETINYEQTPEWHEAVMACTDGHGADCIVEVGGVGTLGRSYRSVAPGGKIGMIGMLTDADDVPNPRALLGPGASLHGIMVGGRDLFSDMNAALDVNDLHPVIDHTFSFDEAPEAYRYHQSAAHLGKIVISISK